MLIQYCESCGSRVSESDFQNGAFQVEDKAYCPKCAVAVPRHKKPPTGGPHAPTRGSEKGTSNSRLQAINKPATGKTAAVHGHKPHSHAHAPNQTSSGGVIAIVGIVAVLLIGGFVVMQKPKNESKVSTPKPEEKKTLPTPAPVANTNPPVTNTNTTTNTAPTTTTPPVTATLPPQQADPKEVYASKRWAELKELEKKLQPWAARKELEQFVSIYGETPTGKEAAAYLAKLPPAPPPPQQPTGDFTVLWSNDFEADGNGITAGARSLDNAYGGKGYSLKSVPQENSYFSSKISIDIRRNGNDTIPIGQHSWLRLACYVEGTDTICFHSLFGDTVYEKFIKNMPKGKWQWVTIKMSEYASLKDKSQPKPGMPFKFTAIFGAMWNAKTTLYVDNIMIGDGPIPPEPK